MVSKLNVWEGICGYHPTTCGGKGIPHNDSLLEDKKIVN